jgi:hypothetical protein
MPTELVEAMLAATADLQDLGVPTALMGGLAASAWHYYRATHDVDILIAADVVPPDRLLQSLQGRGYKPYKVPPLTDFDGERVLQLLSRPPGKAYEYRIDLFLAETEYHRMALARRVPFRLPDGKTDVPVVTCEDLILLKVRAGRVLDQGDVVALLQENRGDLDFDYIRRWLSAPDARRLWSDCWQRAFPADADPTTSS